MANARRRPQHALGIDRPADDRRAARQVAGGCASAATTASIAGDRRRRASPARRVREVRGEMGGERALAASPLAIDDGDDGHDRPDRANTPANRPGQNVTAGPERGKGKVVFSIEAGNGRRESAEKSRHRPLRPSAVRHERARRSLRRRGRACAAAPGAGSAGLPRLPRPRMGLPGRRRPAPVREALPRGLPGRPQLADDPQQARGVPRARSPNFDAERVARFGARDVERLLGDAGIVRHRGKIESTINNAQRVLELREEFGSLAAYAWRFEPEPARGRSASRWRRAARARPFRRGDGAVEGPEAARLDASSARPRSTPSCRRWGWSTTTSTAASSALPPRRPDRARGAGAA